MDSNPLLAALQNNYGDGSPPPDDLTTVRGLLSFCKKWLDGETPTSALNNPCIEMGSRLRAGATATDLDLKNSPSLQPEMRAPVERTAMAYRNIAGILEELPQIAAVGDREAYAEAIADFEEERQAVLDAQTTITSQLDGTVRRCPRCGVAAENSEVCPAEPSCQVVPLFPDPKLLNNTNQKTANLTPAHAAVYRAYVAVMDGKESLPHLISALPSLESHLHDLLNQAAQMKTLEATDDAQKDEFEDGKVVSQRLEKEIEASLEGVARMRAVAENFSMSELTRGWDQIFDAGQAIQGALQKFAKAHGYLDPAVLEAADLIQITGD